MGWSAVVRWVVKGLEVLFRSTVVPWGVKGLEVLFRHMLSSGSVSSSAVGSQRT